MTSTKTPPGVWVGQPLHFACLAILLAIVWLAWTTLGRPFPAAFWTAIAIPVAHQVYVWLAWRLELRSSATRQAIGFRGYVVVFFVLFGSRFVSLAALAWMDRGSLGLPTPARIALTGLLAMLGLYAAYSVERYFGMVRAAGADHFDPAYRDMPLVNEGIFRFTRNGMYVYAFLNFWAIAVGLDSSAALSVAAFSHAYIWVHFFATEKPDMDFLYAAAERSPARTS